MSRLQSLVHAARVEQTQWVQHALQGQVNLQQVQTGQVVPASFGDYLWRGDVIQTTENARAEAICNDGVALQVDSEQSVTVTCGETPDPAYQRVILSIREGQVVTLPNPRLEQPGSERLPIILSPRDTFLVESRPTIRWRTVEGAHEYEVVVSKGSKELWRETTQETDLPFPETAPPLEQDADYRIEVIARSEADAPPLAAEKVWLWMLAQAETEQTAVLKVQVEGSGLSPESSGLFLAVYDLQHQLYDAAIAKLSTVVKTMPSSLAYRLLGDAYLGVELDQEAEQCYQEAYRLAEATATGTADSRLLQAEAGVGLGHAAYASRDYERALDHYQAARTLYRELGMESQETAVAAFIDEARKRIH